MFISSEAVSEIDEYPSVRLTNILTSILDPGSVARVIDKIQLCYIVFNASY